MNVLNLLQGEEIYDATLNQTNVGDNNNKFYVIQALGVFLWAHFLHSLHSSEQMQVNISVLQIIVDFTSDHFKFLFMSFFLSSVFFLPHRFTPVANSSQHLKELQLFLQWTNLLSLFSQLLLLSIQSIIWREPDIIKIKL